MAWSWKGAAGDRRLVAVNYAANQSQCYVRVPLEDLGASTVRFDDLMGDGQFDREKSDLDARGLYLDIPAWQAMTCSKSARLKSRAPENARRPRRRAIARLQSIHRNAKRGRRGGADRVGKKRLAGPQRCSSRTAPIADHHDARDEERIHGPYGLAGVGLVARGVRWMGRVPLDLCAAGSGGCRAAHAALHS